MRRTLRLLRGSSRGVTLIEVLIAMALVGIIAAAFLGGLSTASRAVLTGDIRTMAESLASTQMESVKSQPYIECGAGQYSIVAHRADYEILVDCEPIDPSTGDPYEDENGTTGEDEGIQKILVTVSHHGEVVIVLEGYNRRGDEDE